MRNKETCIRLMDKLDGKLQTLLFILSRPNADANEFRSVIEEIEDTSSNMRRFIEREEQTM